MAFTRTGAPSTLTLYTTHPLSPPTLATLQRDFDLAAFSPRHASVLLSISPRTDLYGLSAEGVLKQVTEERASRSKGTQDAPDEDEYEAGFLVADESTERDGDGLWYVEGWFTEEDLGEDFLDPEAKKKVKYDEEGKSNIAEKLRIFMHYAPLLRVNLDIANIGIPEMYSFPYNPDSPHNLIPEDGGADWRFMSPPNAYIIAGPSAYESNTNAETGSTTKRLGASKEENNELRMYRLTDEWAEKLGVIPSWNPGWEWEGSPKDEEETRLAEQAQIFESDKKTVKKGVVSFAQAWKWEAPDLPKKLMAGWKSKSREGKEDE